MFLLSTFTSNTDTIYCGNPPVSSSSFPQRKDHHINTPFTTTTMPTPQFALSHTRTFLQPPELETGSYYPAGINTQTTAAYHRMYLTYTPAHTAQKHSRSMLPRLYEPPRSQYAEKQCTKAAISTRLQVKNDDIDITPLKYDIPHNTATASDNLFISNSSWTVLV